MSLRVMAFVTVVLACAAVAHSQDVSLPTGEAARFMDVRGGLGVDAAVARALEREPSLRSVRSEVDVARGMLQQAGLRPNPTLNVERRGEPGGTDSLTTIAVEWPLDLFRRPGRVGTADREVEQVRLGVEDRERLLVADVRLQYGATAAAVREVAVADEVAAAARRQLDLVRSRVDAGGAPPLERDLLDVEVRRLEVARDLAVGRADQALVRLKQFLGMAPGEPLQLRDALDVLVGATASETPMAAAAPAARPDVREADVRVTLADARLDQARRDGRVDVSLFGTYMRMNNGFPQRGFGPSGALERVAGRFDYLAAGAAVSIPLLNRNQGQIAAARAERTSAEARREAVELSARAEMAAAKARDVQAQRAFQMYADGVTALARRNLDVVRQTFELGRATVFDVLAEQRRFLEVEQGYIEVAREAWEARVALTRAMGETR
jgi:outer membrane protein, heavy metal efflux system